MTHNLKYMYAFGIAWSIGFFSILHWCLYASDTRGPIIGLAAILYGVGYGLAGRFFGKRDPANKTRMNLPFAYSLAGSITSLLVGSIWVMLWRHDELDTLIIIALVFTLISIASYLSTRKSIKGIPAKELFK